MDLVSDSDSDDDEDIVELDRNGREIPLAQQAPTHMPAVSLPPPRHQNLRPRRRAAEANQASGSGSGGGSGLQIIDNPPRPRRGQPGVAPVAAEAGAAGGGGGRLGGAILSLGNARNGFRRIGFAASAPQHQPIDVDDDELHRHLDPNDDGGVRRNAPNPLSFFHMLHEFGGNLGQNGFWDFNFGMGYYAANARRPASAGFRDEDDGALLNDAPEFKPAFIHKTKHPRPGFTYDFDRLPTSIWKPLPSEPGPSTSNSNSWSASLARGLGVGSKRKPSPTIIDVDLQPSRSPTPDSDISVSRLPTLLCSSCPRPLIIGGDGDDRIWALRCGHLLCGACLDQIGIPPPARPKTLLERLGEVPVYASGGGRKGKGKGKVKARDVKGKGKARMVSESVEPDAGVRPFPITEDGSLLTQDDRNLAADLQNAHTIDNFESSSLLRSGRRRYSGPRHDQNPLVSFSEGWPVPEHEQQQASSSVIDVDALPSPVTSRTSTRTRRAAPSTSTSTAAIKQRRKPSGTSRTKGGKPRVLRQWEYECPVEECKRPHVRVLVGPNLSSPTTAWRGKADVGEIAVYT